MEPERPSEAIRYMYSYWVPISSQLKHSIGQGSLSRTRNFKRGVSLRLKQSTTHKYQEVSETYKIHTAYQSLILSTSKD